MIKNFSIRDIAAKAGVAPSTVSSVLNGKAKQARISDALAERVQAMADAMGYKPNQTAVSLRTGKTKIIGLIVEDISNVFFATLAKTVEDEAYAKGYKIVYCSTENNDSKGCELIRMLLHHQVDGFLITPSAGMKDEISRLLDMKKPVVLMDRYFPDMKVASTLVDNYEGVRNATQHMLSKGYRKIGFVTIDLQQVQMQLREEAFRNALQANNMEVTDDQFLYLSYDMPAAEAIEKIAQFISADTGLDAVFFATNYLGLYGIECVKKMKLSVPEDLAIVCFDDHDIFRLVTPGITIVEQPIVAIAKNAVEILISQFEGKYVENGHYERLQPSRLVVRGSC